MAPQSTLLSLPAEVRLLIFEHLLVRHYTLDLTQPPRDPGQREPHLDSQVLRVCKQFLEEGRVLLYSRNTIRIEPVEGSITKSEQCAGQVWMPSIGDVNRALITRIELNDPQRYTPDDSPIPRYHYWFLHDRGVYPQMRALSWIYLGANMIRFALMHQRLGFGKIRLRFQTWAGKDATAEVKKMVEDEIVRRMVLKAVEAVALVGLAFHKAYRTLRPEEGFRRVDPYGVVLCKAAFAPCECPGFDSRYGVTYVEELDMP